MVARLVQMFGLGACRANDGAARGVIPVAHEEQHEREEHEQQRLGDWLSPQQAAEHTERLEAQHALQLTRVRGEAKAMQDAAVQAAEARQEAAVQAAEARQAAAAVQARQEAETAVQARQEAEAARQEAAAAVEELQRLLAEARRGA